MLQVLGKAYDAAVSACIWLAEEGYLPDFVVRTGIRYLLRLRASEVRWAMGTFIISFMQNLEQTNSGSD
jgi:hypothetical protein